jgi:hypothetical protein
MMPVAVTELCLKFFPPNHREPQHKLGCSSAHVKTAIKRNRCYFFNDIPFY